MLTYIHADSRDEMYLSLAETQGAPLLDIFTTPSLVKVRYTNDASTIAHAAQEIDLFETDNISSKKNIQVFILETAEISETAIIQLKHICNNSQKPIYFSTNAIGTARTQLEKLLKKHSISILNAAKIQPATKTQLVHSYSKRLGVQLSSVHISSILQTTQTLTEIIDIIDILLLLPSNLYDDFVGTSDTQIPLFMLTFRSKLSHSIAMQWISRLWPDYEQLILSLLFTKLEKEHTFDSKKLRKKLIEIDVFAKSQSHTSLSVLLKHFLWSTIQA
jgi:hypothetical protein